MKWFKHFTDNHRGRSVQFLLDELGYFGPFFKDTLLEMCAEKLDRKADRELTEDDCKFVFHRRVVESATRAKRTSVSRALDAGAKCNFWSYKADGDFFEISAPILLDLLEYDQKKSRQRRAPIVPEKRLRIEKNRIEKNREDKHGDCDEAPSSSLPQVSLSSEVWRKYADAYRERYRAEPTRNQKVNGQLKHFVSRVPKEEAAEIAAFYVSHNNFRYVQAGHSIGLLLMDAEKLRTEYLTGKKITKQDALGADLSESLQNQLRRLGGDE